MAARCDPDCFIQHRRDPEGVDRATGEPLEAIGATYHEGCRGRGERVGKLDAVAAQYEKVVVAQGSERLGDRLRMGTCETVGNSRHAHRTSRVGEEPQDGPKHRGFPGRSAVSGSRFDIAITKLVGGLDHDVRHQRLLWLVSARATIESVVTPDSSAISGRGEGMDGTRQIAIGRLSKHTGTNIETIRYYERVGLLPAPARSPGGYRLYGTDHLKRLNFIRRARTLGFSIGEIRTLLRLADERKRPCAEVRVVAEAHLNDVRAKIGDLKAMERVLKETVARCAKGTGSHCPVIDALYREPGTPGPVLSAVRSAIAAKRRPRGAPATASQASR